jgi:hypothetical protein
MTRRSHDAGDLDFAAPVDWLLQSDGRGMAISAGNFYGMHQHVSGRASNLEPASFGWRILADSTTIMRLEAWYESPEGPNEQLRTVLVLPDGGTVVVAPDAFMLVPYGGVWRGEVYGSVRARSLGQNIWLHRVAIDIYPPAPAGAWADENWGLQLLNGGPGSVSVDAWIERDDRYQAVFHGAGINPHRTLGRLACGNKPIAVGSYYGAPADAELRRAAAYSSAGPRRSGIEPNNQQPFLSAPGDGIHAARSKTRDVWTVKSGTSMAAAHVSGVIALLLQQDDSLNIDAIKAMLRQTCRGNLPDPPDFELQPAGPPGPWDPQNWDQQYGHGRIDATATLIADGP